MSNPSTQRVSAPNALPTPPAVLARVVTLAGDPNRSLQELGAACAQDPGLTVELLRAANSARHHGADAVRSVPQAVIKIGARAVRALAITHTVRTAVGNLRAAGFDARAFWEDSLRRAASAQLLAEHLDYDDPHEAFAVGLTQDIGTLLIAVLMPHRAEALTTLRSRPGRTRLDAERILTGTSHTDPALTESLLSALPEEFRFAVAHHHAPPPGTTRAHILARIAHGADLLSDVVQSFPKPTCIEAATAALQGLGVPASVTELVDALQGRVTALAAELQLQVSAQPDMEEVHRLAKEALERIESAESVEATEAKAPAEPGTDALTGLPDVRSFQGHILRRAADASSKALFLVEIQGLEAVGDQDVLDASVRRIADQLRRVARAPEDLARIGAGRFALVFTGSLRQSERVGQALCALLRQTPVHGQGNAVQLALRLGASHASGSTRAQTLVRAASQALTASRTATSRSIQWRLAGAESPELAEAV